MVDFNIETENKIDSESEDERKGWSKSPIPPTPKKEQKLMAGQLNIQCLNITSVSEINNKQISISIHITLSVKDAFSIFILI